MSETASDIRDKLRPQAITSEVSGYIKSRGEELVHNLTDAARRNPMQAVAVGASVAYPLDAARPIHSSAGLDDGRRVSSLADRRRAGIWTQQASDAAGDLADEVRRRAHDLGDQVTQAASSAQDYVADTVEQMKGSATGTMEAVQDQMGSAAQRKRCGQLRPVPRLQREPTMHSNATAAMTDTLEIASVAGRRFGQQHHGQRGAGRTGLRGAAARERLVEAGSRAGRTVQETVEQNPLLTAGAGLLIGGLLASALPSFDLEDDLMGDTSERCGGAPMRPRTKRR